MTEICETTPVGADKIKRYKWASTLCEREHRYIHKSQIGIDESYQRSVSQNKIDSLRKSWDNVKVGSLLIGQRQDGSLWVVDGQHRLKAALCRSDVQVLECDVFQSRGVEHEAEVFTGVNKDRKPLDSVQLHKAGVASGNQIDIGIDSVLRTYGVKMIGGGTSKSCVSIRCVGDIKHIINTYGFEAFESSIKYLSYIQNNGSRIDGYVLKGTAYILANYTIPNKQSFEDAFLKCTPSKLKSSITFVISEQQKMGDRMYALAVAKEINSHLRKNKIRAKENL